MSQNSDKTLQLSASFLQPPSEAVNSSLQPQQLRQAQQQSLAIEGSFSFENQNSLVKKQTEEDQILKQSELRTVASVGIQCESGTQNFFEPLDMRVCLRCGLNDKTSAAQCLFHPSRPKVAGGSGNMLYSAEWHKCREHCRDKAVEEGCTGEAKHFYGSHLPADGKKSPRASRSPVAARRRYSMTKAKKEFAEKDSMTDISLLFNPFTSQLGESKAAPKRDPTAYKTDQQTEQTDHESRSHRSKRIQEKPACKSPLKKPSPGDRSRSPTPRMDELMRRSALSSMSIDDSLSSSTIATQQRGNAHNITTTKNPALDESTLSRTSNKSHSRKCKHHPVHSFQQPSGKILVEDGSTLKQRRSSLRKSQSKSPQPSHRNS